MPEIMDTTEVKKDFWEFNEKLVVQKLRLPNNGSICRANRLLEIFLLKNNEYEDELGIGVHNLSPWRKILDNSNKKEEYFSIFKVETKSVYSEEMKIENFKNYYDKKMSVNFKYKINCTYSYKISDSFTFIKSTATFQDKYSYRNLHKYINNELSSNIMSFIAKSLLEKDISILEFNTYIKEFSSSFMDYANKSIFNLSGLQFFDFNFVSLIFDNNSIFKEINKTLYEKADMLLRDYNYKEKSKYNILSIRKKKEPKHIQSLIKAKEDDE